MNEEERNIGVPQRSNIENFKDSMESNFWLDLKDELDEWLGDVHVQLEDSDGMATEKMLNRLGGIAEAIRHFQLMPEIMLNNAIEDQKED